jgi:hypothetical protein
MNKLVMTAGAAVICTAILIGAGCEDDSVAEGDEFRINPAAVALSKSNRTAVLQVIGGHPPFTWRVTDDTLGAVSGGGTVVTYTRNDPNGANTVEVVDDLGWRATATILQQDDEEEPDDFTATPTTATLNANGDIVVVTAAGGVRPYGWTVLNGALGHLVPGGTTDSSVVYQRDAAGPNVLIAQDRQGRVVNVSIAQP